MLNPRKLQALLALALAGASSAFADTLLDTGPGPTSGGGWAVYSGQYLAAEVTFGNAVTIDSIEGWMFASQAATYTVTLSADDNPIGPAGERPGTELFSANFGATPGPYNWQGAFGLGWSLGAGSYWISFSNSQSIVAGGGMPYDATSPLTNTAVWSGEHNFWFPTDNLNIDLRILGSESTPSVPDAGSSIVLLASGLALLTLWRRRKAD